MRHVDEVRELRRELGRRDKMIGDRETELAELRREIEGARQGAVEVQGLVDAVLTAVALKYGQRGEDPGAWRLELTGFDPAELRRQYEIHAGRGKDGYVIGVRSRGE